MLYWLALWLILSFLSYIAHAHWPKEGAAQSGLSPPNQSPIRAFFHRHDLRLMRCRQFFNGSSLPKVTLCYVKLTIETNQYSNQLPLNKKAQLTSSTFNNMNQCQNIMLSGRNWTGKYTSLYFNNKEGKHESTV